MREQQLHSWLTQRNAHHHPQDDHIHIIIQIINNVSSMIGSGHGYLIDTENSISLVATECALIHQPWLSSANFRQGGAGVAGRQVTALIGQFLYPLFRSFAQEVQGWFVVLEIGIWWRRQLVSAALPSSDMVGWSAIDCKNLKTIDQGARPVLKYVIGLKRIINHLISI